MTVSNEDSRTGPYNGDGSTTSFEFDFLLLSKSHLVVTLTAADGISTEQALDVDYTIPDDDVNDPAGGTITMATAPASGEQLTITREVTRDQEVDLQNRGSFFPETIERALDKLTQITQDHREILDRSIKQAVTETADLTFPQASDGQAIGWDGSSLTNITSVDGATLLSLHEVLGKVPSGADGIFIGEQEVLGRLTGGDLQSLTANDVYTILREQELVPEAGAVPQWQYSQSATYIDSDTFTLSGRTQSLTGDHPYEGAGRRILVLLESTNAYRWATVDSASYDGVADETTVNLAALTDVSGASAGLENEPLTVWAHIDGVVPDVSSVASLRAASFSPDADRLWLRGYTASDPGTGSGVLYRDAADTTTADNGGTVLVDSDGVRWKRTAKGFVDIFEFGAKGDGVTDDASSFTDAVSSLPASGGTIWLGKPGSNFLLKSTVVLDKPVRLIGHGHSDQAGASGGTILTKDDTLSAPLLQITGKSCILDGLVIDAEAGNGGDGVSVEAGRCVIQHVSVFNQGGDGIRIGNSAGSNANIWRLSNVITRSNGGNGVNIDDGSTTDAGLANVNAGVCVGLETSSNNADGLNVGTALRNDFVGVTAQGNSGNGVHFEVNSQEQRLFGGDQDEGNLVNEILNEGVGNAFFHATQSGLVDNGTETVNIGRTKTQITKLEDLQLRDGGELTISAGEVTITGSRHTIDTEADAASDNLDTINGGVEGQILVISSASTSRDVTVKDGTGNVRLVGDFIMGTVDDKLMLINRAGLVWNELSRANP